MASFLVLHLCEPRLGQPPGTSPERASDRLAAFERAIDEALSRAADAILVGGRMFDPAVPQPSLLGELEDLLARARSGGAPVIATLESGADAWLAHLASRDLLTLLPVSREAAILPYAEPRRNLRVVGLGRPQSATDLRERAERMLAAIPGITTLALLDAAPWIEANDLAPVADRVAWVALGGSPERRALRANTRDPGPLTRLELGAALDPSVLWIRCDDGLARAEETATGDRPLERITIDLTDALAPLDVEIALAARLQALRPAVRPLVTIDLIGAASFDVRLLDTDELARLALAAVQPVETRVRVQPHLRTGAGDRVGGVPRAVLEQAVLERLAASLSGETRALAAPVLADFALDDPACVDRAAARLAASLKPGTAAGALPTDATTTTTAGRDAADATQPRAKEKRRARR